ncbi:MAG: ABC transporter permease [Christensenellaceae bacterium]|jgi:putative ABC transport system permease protein|nr:ABC transporter permease [Christensenellaceae bacterium]
MLEIFVHAFKSIWISPRRTFLTVLGLIIAASFYVVSSIFSNAIVTMQTEKYNNFPINGVFITSTLYNENIDMMQTDFANTYVLPFYYESSYSVHIPAESASSKIEVFGQVIGAYQDFYNFATPSIDTYNAIEQSNMIFGRGFSDEDILLERKVAIINYSFSKMFFGDNNPLGKELALKDKGDYVVVGVLEDTDDIKRTINKGISDAEKNGQSEILMPVYVPIATINHTNAQASRKTIVFFSQVSMDSAVSSLENYISARGGITIFSRETIIAAIEEDAKKSNTTMQFLLAMMLFMSGLSLMTILLFSFKERTKEIAVRKAIGARNWDIVTQFTIESLYYGLIGGLSGALIGLILTVIVGPFVMETTAMTILSSLKAYTFTIPLFACLSVSLLFSIIPSLVIANKPVMHALQGEN